VTLNGVDDDLARSTTVEELVIGLGRGRSGIAVALNDEVVPRGRWATTELHPNDRVEILTAAQGG